MTRAEYSKSEVYRGEDARGRWDICGAVFQDKTLTILADSALKAVG